MAKINQRSLERQRQAEQLWLLYYNQYLYEHGVISERERNRMKNAINTRKRCPQHERGAR